MEEFKSCSRDGEQAIKVDDLDRKIGEISKSEAHKINSPLHRAVSIFIFNDEGKLLIQQRALGKIPAPGVWSNTCCAHPKPDQSVEEAAAENLLLEMNIKCKLTKIGVFKLAEEIGGGYAWNELDHIFVGKFNGQAKPNHKEVENVKWVSIDSLKQDMLENPSKYSGVLRNAIELAQKHIKTNKKVVR